MRQRDSPPTIAAAAARDNTQPRKRSIVSTASQNKTAQAQRRKRHGSPYHLYPHVLGDVAVAAVVHEPRHVAVLFCIHDQGLLKRGADGMGERRQYGRADEDIKASRYSRAADTAIVTFFVNFAL